MQGNRLVMGERKRDVAEWERREIRDFVRESEVFRWAFL